jgi:hypothetical protein
MGLFANLFSSKAADKKSDKHDVFFLIGDLKYAVQVTGVEHYQSALEAICGPRKPGGVDRLETAWLILEEQNSRDKNAVRVEIRGRQVGYLSSESAIRFRRKRMERNLPGAIGQCQAVITGGWVSSDGRKGDYEVWLDAPSLTH